MNASSPDSSRSSASSRAAVGFIGVGVMGEPMASNLLAAGYHVVVHNRSSAAVDRLVAGGATAASTPADVASRCRTVVTMLPDGPDVEKVLLGDEGVLATLPPGSLVVDTSTTSAEVARRLAREVEDRGSQFLDAPVSGGDAGAKAGTLSIMVGGGREACARARPLLGVLGQSVVHVGPAGSGQTVKAANQMLVAGTIALVSEAITFVEAAGVDPAAALAVLTKGLAGNRVLDVKGDRMLAGEFAPGFRLELQRKDLRIAREQAAAIGVSLPLSDAVFELVERAVNDGLAALDHSALIVEVRRRATGDAPAIAPPQRR